MSANLTVVSLTTGKLIDSPASPYAKGHGYPWPQPANKKTPGNSHTGFWI